MEELKEYKKSDIVVFITVTSIPAAIIFAGLIYGMAFLLGI